VLGEKRYPVTWSTATVFPARVGEGCGLGRGDGVGEGVRLADGDGDGDAVRRGAAVRAVVAVTAGAAVEALGAAVVGSRGCGELSSGVPEPEEQAASSATGRTQLVRTAAG
jgi:hypothetical protein